MERVLESIHSDVCGPINPSSNGGKRYFITFIDDYTRKTWVYFLKEKSEAFNTFKSFKARVEMKQKEPLKLFALIEVESTTQKNLKIYVMFKA